MIPSSRWFALIALPTAFANALAEKEAGKPATAQMSTLKDKTLIAWIAPANLEQRGGSALTMDDNQAHFDGVVFGELAPGKWMAGSDFHKRTRKDQSTWPPETANTNTLVQIAVAYKDREITIYRNGQRYAQYTADSAPQTFGPGSVAVFGLRHLENQRDHFAGAISDARIYDQALSAEQIAALKPKELSDPKPWAWWPFEDAACRDRMGRFTHTRLIGGAKVEGGKLLLDGKRGALLAAQTAPQLASAEPSALPLSLSQKPILPDDIMAARRLRNHFLSDPHRPTYHFVIPEDYAMPFDPNGAIYWRGRYHLFYIYQEKGAHCFGHVSSVDLLHWRQHPPALYATPDSPEKGIFSGNCFVNKKGEATMLYHGYGAGNCIATASDDNLEQWKKLPSNPIIPNTTGSEPYASWDPCGWLDGDTYYAIFGGQPGKSPKPATIFKAKELDQWKYVGPFLHHEMPDVAANEDISCADFFKLGAKWVLICISHNRGARYYVGDWKNEQFHPEVHERMTWVDNLYFAPESLAAPDGRRILWAWIFDQRNKETKQASGWSGEMSLPRDVALGDDGRLRIRPIAELERLRYNEQTMRDIDVAEGQETALEKIHGNTIELLLEIEPRGARQFGVRVCCSPSGEEQTTILYDAAEKMLKIDTTKSSLKEGPKKIESAPLTLNDSEPLMLRVFVDRSVVEAFANDRQAAMRRIYPSRADSIGVSLFSAGGAMKIRQLKAWQMAPSNPW
ncbi:MAG: GH32 C-terminal domain-containing protein [Candidatus Sumerlaeota bacterium]|nr:GH32 C-terminal domain-containing protein [Candidatus Sumerlaeota bacterium]